MKFCFMHSFTQSLVTLVVSTMIFSIAGLDANAQTRLGQNWFGTPHSRSAGNIQAIYQNNSRQRLGGLFAPDFSRTLTILGGLNYPSAGTADIFASELDATLIEPDGFESSREGLDDPGYALSFAFGRRHSNTLRSEIEVGIRGNDIINNTVIGFDDTPGITETEENVGSVNAVSLMKNFIIDFDNNSRFTPYVGAGLGVSYVEVEFGDSSEFEEGQTLFSYQAIGGIATRLTSAADFIVEYRFLGTSEVEFDEFGQELAYNTSNLFFGIKLEY